MSKVLIIGAGGVGGVVAHKCAMNSPIFTEIMLASRTKSKCDKIAADIQEMHGVSIQTASVDADIVAEMVVLIKSFQPKMVINVALPYQDLTIMEACLANAYTIWIPPITNPKTWPNLNTVGSGRIRNVSKKRV